MLQNILRICRHNQGICISTVMCLVLLLWAYGCASETQSLLDPTKKVNRTELNAEVVILNETVKVREQDLNQQDKIKRAIFEAALMYAQNNAINPISLMLTLGNIIGIGAVIDNRRKDGIIKTLKSNGPTG